MVFLPHWPKPTMSPKGDLISFLNLLDKLGNPQHKLANVIHIAGTNGKGSSVAILSSIIREAGYSVDCYTSPHLLECNERISLDGNYVSDELLFITLETVRKAAESLNMEVGLFQALTAAAFIIFSQRNSDYIILETGLGGAFDPTNAIAKPLLSLITTISYDHQAVLGESIEQIARAKAGIIKQETPCIISAQMDEVYPILFEMCDIQQSPSMAYEYDYIVENGTNAYCFKNKENEITYNLPNMPGSHQAINSSACLAAICYLREHSRCIITNEHIKTGLEQAQWKGRISKITADNSHSLPNDKIFWLDGAHNLSGAQALSDWAKYDLQKPIIIILAMTKKRDVKKFLQPFADITKHVYTVNVKSEADSYPAETTAALMDNMITNTACDDLHEVLAHIAKDKTENIVVTGSLFLVADFYKLLHGKY